MSSHLSGDRSSRRTARRAFGALLLALPLYGLAFQLTPAHAQPTPKVSNTFQPATLSLTQNAEIERVMSIERYENFCKNALDLKLEDATIEDAITRIKTAFPGQKVEIRQRDARPLKFSLDLKETTVGTVLNGVASLADCKLWIFPDGLLIAPPGKLNTVERELVDQSLAGDWSQISENNAQGWSNHSEGQRAFANVIAQEVKLNNAMPQDGPLKTTFGQFSPQGQKALQQLVTLARSDTIRYMPGALPFILGPDSPIKVDLSRPRFIAIDFDKSASDSAPNAMAMVISLGEPTQF